MTATRQKQLERLLRRLRKTYPDSQDNKHSRVLKRVWNRLHSDKQPTNPAKEAWANSMYL